MTSDFNGFKKAMFYGKVEYIIYYTNKLILIEELEQKEIITDIVEFLSSPKGLIIFILESFERTYSNFIYLMPLSILAKNLKKNIIEGNS